jgi:hypothetical protein
MGTLMTIVGESFAVDYDPWKPFNIVRGDYISEIDMNTHEVLWEWHLRDYVDPVEHHNEHEMEGVVHGYRAWTHCNTLKFYEGYVYKENTYNAVLLNSRHLDTFWMIDYNTGDVLWSCGQHGTFGRREPPEEPLFSHAHDVEMLSPTRFIMYDNGNFRRPARSRALEIRVNPEGEISEEVWSWSPPRKQENRYYDWAMGDANRLPNGNTILVNSMRGRIIEVTPEDDKVWEMLMLHPIPGANHSLYKCERIISP